MKITKTKLAKVIAEEVEAFLRNEVSGRFGGADLRALASKHAHQDYLKQKQQDDDEEERARREREFQKAHKAQKASGEGLPDWMIEEEEDDLEGPESRRAWLGDAVADVLVDALDEYLREFDLDPGVQNNIMLDVEEPLLDVAIQVSKAVGTHSRFSPEEMMESRKRSRRRVKRVKR